MNAPTLKTLALIIATLPYAALAENTATPRPEQTAELQTVNVTGKNRSTRTENRDSYTTSAMRTTTGLALSPKETPQSVSVITKTQINEQGITNLVDALKTTTGVNVIRDAGIPRFQSRGFYIDQIEEDGISSTVPGAINNPMYDAQSMNDIAVYDHIEVVRGATGLTQANGEPGGTVNAVRKRPTGERIIQGEVQIDRFGKVRTTGDFSGRLNDEGTLRGRAVVALEHDKNFKDRVKGGNATLYGVMDASVGDNTKITWGGLYQRKHTKPDDWGVALNLPRDTYLGYNWNKGVYDKANAFAEVEHYFNDNWRYTGKLDYNYNENTKKNSGIYNTSTSYAGYTPGGTLASGWLSRYDNDEKQLTFKNNLNGKFEIAGVPQEIFTEYTYTHTKNNGSRRQYNPGVSFDPMTFTGNEIAEPADWYATPYQMYWETHSKRTTHALLLGFRFNMLKEKLHIMAGTRWNHIKSKYITDYFYTGGKIDSDPDSVTDRKTVRFNPYFAVTYDLTPNQSLYASYTSIFKPNSNQRKDKSYLEPVTGANYEIGWKGEWFDRKLNTSLALFDIEQKNRAVQVWDTADQKWYWEPVGEVRSRGIEAEISGNLSEDWKLFAGYTFNRSKYLEAESKGTVPAGTNFSLHTPKHMLRLHTSYNLPFNGKKWTIGGGVTAQSKTASLYGVKRGGHAVFNANIDYQASKNLKLALISTNLFNRYYYENNKVSSKGANNYYGQPRNVMFKVDYKF
ncbi:TPA: TonB-dependent siderophore receptor [Neisseria subflava]|jgi:tonB-dependent siderophore receptor